MIYFLQVFLSRPMLRARYIRNALVRMAYFSWPIFALHSLFCCIFLAIVAGIKIILVQLVGARFNSQR